MGLAGSSSPFGQAYGQGAGQQLGAGGVNAPLQNSLPPFPSDLKGAAVTNVANLVSSRGTNQTVLWFIINILSLAVQAVIKQSTRLCLKMIKDECTGVIKMQICCCRCLLGGWCPLWVFT